MTLDDSSEDESISSDDNYDTESETEAGNAPPYNTEDCNAVYDEPTLDYMYNVPVPKCRDPRTMSLTPISIAVVDTIGLVRSRKLLKVLFDPGSTRTLIKKSIVPEKAVPISLGREKRVKTITGSLNTRKMTRLRDIRLPEFDKNRRIDQIKALIFDNECKYDIIFGADFLSWIGLNILYRQGVIDWCGNTLPM